MVEKVPQLTEEQKLIVEKLKAQQEKELKTKRLEIEALKILKVKKEDKLEELQKFNSNIVADYDNINIPDRWIKLIQDQNIQTHQGYFTAGLKSLLLEKISELKAMRETRDKLLGELEKGDAALKKVSQKTNELNELRNYIMNHNESIDQSVDIEKPKAMVSTAQYDKLMKCHNLVKEIRQLETDLQTHADSRQGLIASFSDANALEMNTFLTNIKQRLSEQKEKEQEDIDKLLAEYDPNSI